MAHGLDLDETNFPFNKNIVENPEVLDAEFPVGQFALTQLLPVSRLGRRLMTQLLIDCLKDNILLKFAIGTDVVDGSLV